MGFKVQEIKSALQHGGASASLFHVSLQLPSALEISGKDAFTRKITFLCTASNLPGSDIGKIAVPYQGRKIHVAGKRKFETDWQITVINDEDFLLRNAFEAWADAINSSANNIRNSGATSSPETYKTDAIVKQYAKDNDVNPIKKKKLVGLFVTKVEEIKLDWATEDEIEKFTVDFSIDYHEDDSSAE